jgi:hypothetical protein
MLFEPFNAGSGICGEVSRYRETVVATINVDARFSGFLAISAGRNATIALKF